jgi:hypothetical protein
MVDYEGFVVVGGNTGEEIFFLFVDDFLFFHSSFLVRLAL